MDPIEQTLLDKKNNLERIVDDQPNKKQKTGESMDYEINLLSNLSPQPKKVNFFGVDLEEVIDFEKSENKNCHFSSLNAKEKKIVSELVPLVEMGLSKIYKHYILNIEDDYLSKKTDLEADVMKELGSAIKSTMTLLSQFGKVSKELVSLLLSRMENGEFSDESINQYLQSTFVVSVIDFHLFNVLEMNFHENAQVVQKQGDKLIRGSVNQMIDEVVLFYKNLITYRSVEGDLKVFDLVDDVSFDNTTNRIDDKRYAFLSAFISDHLVLRQPSSNVRKEDTIAAAGKFPARISIKPNYLKKIGSTYQYGPLNINIPEELGVKSSVNFFIDQYKSFIIKFKALNNYIDVNSKVRTLSPLQTIMENMSVPVLIDSDSEQTNDYKINNILGNAYNNNSVLGHFFPPLLKGLLEKVMNIQEFQTLFPNHFTLKFDKKWKDLQFIYKLMILKSIVVSFCVSRAELDQKRSSFENLVNFLGQIVSGDNGQLSRNSFLRGSDISGVVHGLLNAKDNNYKPEDLLVVGSSRDQKEIAKVGVSFLDKNEFKVKSEMGKGSNIRLDPAKFPSNKKIIVDQASMNATNISHFTLECVKKQCDVIVIDSYKRENTLLVTSRHSTIYSEVVANFKPMTHDSYIVVFGQNGYKSEQANNMTSERKLQFNESSERKFVYGFKTSFLKYVQTLENASIDDKLLQKQIKNYIIKRVSTRIKPETVQDEPDENDVIENFDFGVSFDF